MSLYINACNIFIVAVQQLPDPALQEIYQKSLNCPITQIQSGISPNLPTFPINQINNFFPHEIQWWPLYTSDEINSKSFKRMLAHGIKPGIILSNQHLSLKQYQQEKYAVLQGAIPVLEYNPQYPNYFNSKALFYTALGLRPLAAYISTGWNPNILSHGNGTYIFKNTDTHQLPLPTRTISFKNQTFYAAQLNPHTLTGTQIIINPPNNIPLNNIIYPQLKISWQFHGVTFTSTKDGIETSFLGHILIPLSLLAIPIDVILNSHYTDILSSVGTSISWISLFLGLVLLLILIISIIKRVRKNESD